jgi:hypothetical protein
VRLVQRRERVQRGERRDQRIVEDARPVDIGPPCTTRWPTPGNLLPRQMRAQRLDQIAASPAAWSAAQSR